MSDLSEPPRAAGAPEPSDQYVQSLVRGLSVIRAFDADRPQMTLSEIAATTSLTRATARRFLLTLVEVGYVHTDGRLFSLTPRVLELGFSYLSSLGLPATAQPFLEELSRLTGESSSASVLDTDEIVYVARVAVRRIMSVTISIGTRMPASVTSMGRVLLAGLPPDALEAYLDRAHLLAPTPRSLSDRASLEAELTRVRSAGYALVDQELELGLRSIAVPVTGRPTDRPTALPTALPAAVVAAINISVSAGTHTVSDMTENLLPALLRTARALSAALAATP